MTLYLHFGIYKAGSSYIQYLCMHQQHILKENGILFPWSSEAEKMKKGLISKGNAENLTNALNHLKASKVRRILRKWSLTAKDENCEIVLISAESLIHQIVVKTKLKLLTAEAKNTGFQEIRMMGFFRDLADHALSTYKHRAKSGGLGNHINWIKNKYETPYLLNELDKVVEEHKNISWTLRKFKKNSKYLKSSFFNEWLKVELADFESKENVNESVTLSEITLLTHLKKKYPNVLDFFVDDLKALPKEFKAPDKHLENIYFNDFIKHLKNFKDQIKSINKYFSDNEKLVIGELDSNVADNINNAMLSEKQLKVISDRIHFFKTNEGKYILFRRYIVSKLLFKKRHDLNFNFTNKKNVSLFTYRY